MTCELIPAIERRYCNKVEILDPCDWLITVMLTCYCPLLVFNGSEYVEAQ